MLQKKSNQPVQTPTDQTIWQTDCCDPPESRDADKGLGLGKLSWSKKTRMAIRKFKKNMPQMLLTHQENSPLSL
jgi:hypothetical protein